MTQSEVARRYLAALTDELGGRAAKDNALSPFVDELQSIDTSRVQRGPSPRLDHPAMRSLEPAIGKAAGPPQLVTAAVHAARHLDWSPVYGGGGIDPILAAGMLAAQAAGSYGCFASSTVATGQFLLAPGIFYPLHTHAAPEIYFCLSGKMEIQHGLEQPPFLLTPGDVSITPAHRLHSLRVGRDPVILLYVWIGDLTAPMWIWSQADGSSWQRQSWRRKPGEPWTVEQTEPVTPALMLQALS